MLLSVIMDYSSDQDDKKDICNNNNFIGRQHDKFKRHSDKKSHQKSYNCLNAIILFKLRNDWTATSGPAMMWNQFIPARCARTHLHDLITNNDILRLVCLGRGNMSLLPVVHAVAVEKYSLMELIYIIMACCIMLRRYPKVIPNEKAGNYPGFQQEFKSQSCSYLQRRQLGFQPCCLQFSYWRFEGRFGWNQWENIFCLSVGNSSL